MFMIHKKNKDLVLRACNKLLNKVHLLLQVPPQFHQQSPKGMVEPISFCNLPLEMNQASDLFMAVSVGAEANRIRIIELAISAMDELTRKGLGGKPLWEIQGAISGIEVLNEGEYVREFRAFDASMKELMRLIGLGELQNFGNIDGNGEDVNGRGYMNSLSQRDLGPDVLRNEGSRVIEYVDMKSSYLVGLFMDLNQWSLVFSSIVSRATLLGVIPMDSSGNNDETLQVIRAEFHMPTPLVQVRECQFLRYQKQIGPGMWGIVDVSMEDLFPYPLVRYRRRPSGCLIHEVPDGGSKVIWVEHWEASNTYTHELFRPLVLSGFAFSSRRWLYAMIRYCHLLSSLYLQGPTLTDAGLIPHKGKQSLLRLSERMMRTFCLNNSASTSNLWINLPIGNCEDFKVMTKTLATSPGKLNTTIAFTTSLWLQSPPKRVFDFLRHVDSRNKWDVLSHNLVIREVSHIVVGESLENRISILQAKSAPDQTETLYIQESYSDMTGSYIVYAPIDINTMAEVLSGGDSDRVNILTSGFVIHPYKPTLISGEQDVGGSLLTIAFHIIDNTSKENFVNPESINTIRRILTDTAALIQETVVPDGD